MDGDEIRNLDGTLPLYDGVTGEESLVEIDTGGRAELRISATGPVAQQVRRFES